MEKSYSRSILFVDGRKAAKSHGPLSYGDRLIHGRQIIERMDEKDTC